ncbi:hypothetical protein JHR61_09910, partial [Campylobacter jejuni]|nr:hypothetical protein [Campylobacter jejuni]
MHKDVGNDSLKQSSKRQKRRKTMMTLKMHSFDDENDKKLSFRSNVIVH